MKINLRKAEDNDLDFLLKLEKESFPLYQQNSKKNIKHGINSNFQEVLIAEDSNNTHIGSIVLFKYKNSLRIYSIGILKSYQNKGYGRLMLNQIKLLAEQKSYQKIILEASESNISLIEWYKANDFEIVKYLNDYYSANENAIKMEYNVTKSPKEKNVKNLIVINKPFKWDNQNLNARVISVKEYINNPDYQNISDYRVFNLCSSYKYQSYGYYVSLLASARGQRVIPNITTIRDFKMHNVIQSAVYDIDEIINSLLSKNKNSSFSMNVYFGQTLAKGYKTLAFKLYQIFEAPLFRVEFIKNDKWLIKNIKILTLAGIPESERELIYDFASDYFNRKRYNFSRLINYKYDVAILVNPQEVNPPSNKEALEKMKKAANSKGVYVEFITKDDIDRINEFDALFIRETTNVNHYTYEFSRLAFAEGLVVVDDPWSILRCSNKIYQNELFKKHKIRTPNTIALTKNFFNKKILEEFNYPIVIKQPDSAFSLGVIKVNNK
jgi:ribosomal protein S18 acetylase RimI-like enzyme/D-alanine-D-alanine ligase-like ATP-grasp enzyme